MTRDQLRRAIAALGGMSVSERDGEIRVNYINGREATAYYTNDRQDALNTAIAMREEQDHGA